MTKYASLNELPSSETLSRSIRGSEPDIPLAFEMMQTKTSIFTRHRVLWDIVLPEGANDNNRIELNASRMRTIRFLGDYSLIHFIDTSEQDVLSGYLDNGGIEGGVRIGLNMKDLTEWTRGRYKSAIPMMKNSTSTTAEDVFWADEIEGAVGSALEEASRILPPVRGNAVAKVAQLPSLLRVNPRGDGF